jgi:large exoprotein involved in heme utilization and adhesion
VVSLENSLITANAVGGRGGQIQITSQGIFNSPTSLITATSEAGQQFDGVVDIRELQSDVRTTLAPLRNNLLSADQVLANSCLTRRNKGRGSFVVTGTGGLPINPYTTFTEYPYLTESATTPTQHPNTQTKPVGNQASASDLRQWKMGDPIVEGNALVKLPDGRLVLIASDPTLENVQKLACLPQQ